MRIAFTGLLMATFALSSCGGWSDSRVNPSNWFGGSSEVPVDTVPVSAETNPLIPQSTGTNLLRRPEAEDRSQPIMNVTELEVAQTPSGAIIRATGVALRQGAFNAELRLDPTAAEGTLAYTFRVVYPEDPTPQGTQNSRTIRAAVTLSRQSLAGISTIRVSGAQNARETRRR
ncbi:hypothetical protein ACFORG_23040 [Lutimaribacter marinistellae]|uniref:Lipoprotein n=1 Tax=Lutimaribacter marinistellae TaxID=1820329 RepID=A0ABV7TQI7_9RHOB